MKEETGPDVFVSVEKWAKEVFVRGQEAPVFHSHSLSVCQVSRWRVVGS